uniref:hypothetical protein n=1 Tax=Falsiroseomonas oryzae TaxID=2766473 RepID=UPI002FDBBFB4
AEHQRDARLAAATVTSLRRLLSGADVTRAEMDAAACFARLHRLHLESEEAVVTPLARAVLPAQATQQLAQEMARRRGLVGSSLVPSPPEP